MAKTDIKLFTFMSAVLLCVSVFFADGSVCYGAESADMAERYYNQDTGYRVVVEDDAELFSEEEEQALADTMAEITSYGNAALKTVAVNSTDAESLARSYYSEQFGTDSGTLFLIDMDNRKLWIHSDGAVYKIITTAYANTITDNVYRKASANDYFGCANEAFGQITSLLKGYRIAQPMKYISNALLAVIGALLLNYVFVSYYAGLRTPDEKQILKRIKKHFYYTKPKAVFTHKIRVYDPVSSDSDGGSGGGGSSGGSSSGGSSGGSSSSGGGGGHSF